MLYNYAMLTVDQLKKITELEEKLGKTLVAFQAQDYPFAELTPEEMADVARVEEELGLSVVAVTA
jgi:hypothetical protein